MKRRLKTINYLTQEEFAPWTYLLAMAVFVGEVRQSLQSTSPIFLVNPFL